MKEEKPPDDRELVKLAQAGNKGAFGDLVKRYERKMYALTYRFMRNREDAADALQETFIQAYKKISLFEGKSSFSTWLYRIAVNTCLMKKRKKSLSYVSIDKPVETSSGDEITREPVDWADNPLARVDNRDVKAKIEEALQKLPDEYRQVVVLRDMDRFSNNEVAGMLGISLAAVKSRLHRGRLYLRKQLSEYFKSRGQV